MITHNSGSWRLDWVVSFVWRSSVLLAVFCRRGWIGCGLDGRIWTLLARAIQTMLGLEKWHVDGRPHMHDSYDANTEGCDKTCMRIDPEREHILGGVGVQPRTARHKSTPSIISATPPPTFDSWHTTSLGESWLTLPIKSLVGKTYKIGVENKRKYKSPSFIAKNSIGRRNDTKEVGKWPE